MKRKISFFYGCVQLNIFPLYCLKSNLCCTRMYVVEKYISTIKYIILVCWAINPSMIKIEKRSEKGLLSSAHPPSNLSNCASCIFPQFSCPDNNHFYIFSFINFIHLILQISFCKCTVDIICPYIMYPILISLGVLYIVYIKLSL